MLLFLSPVNLMDAIGVDLSTMIKAAFVILRTLIWTVHTMVR